jgi:hypothetical protein
VRRSKPYVLSEIHPKFFLSGIRANGVVKNKAKGYSLKLVTEQKENVVRLHQFVDCADAVEQVFVLHLLEETTVRLHSVVQDCARQIKTTIKGATGYCVHVFLDFALKEGEAESPLGVFGNRLGASTPAAARMSFSVVISRRRFSRSAMVAFWEEELSEAF